MKNENNNEFQLIEENVFNTFILYVKYLAKSYSILIDSNFESNNIKLTLWNKK